MAEAPANVSLGGYDEDFVNAVEDDLQCAICQLPLKDPMLTKCGHRFCRRCLEEHFKSQSTCPIDRTVLIRNRDLFPDKATERKILSLFVHCWSEGCQWTGELRSKNAHLEACPLKIVSCTNASCNETMTKNNLQAHVTTTCPWRILQCIHCSVSHPACKTEDHGLECKRKPLSCPKNCGAVVPREELPTHDEKGCPLTITSCPFSQMGCATKVQRREINTHLQTAIQPHLDLACAKLNSTQEELQRSQDATSKLVERVMALEKELNSKITVNERQYKTLEEKVDSFQTQLNKRAMELEDRVETVEMILKDDSKKVDSLEKKFQRLQVPFNHMQTEVPGIVNRDASSVSNLLQTEEICLQIRPGVWVKDWKIDNISRFIEEAGKCFDYTKESNPFYLGRNSYRCKLLCTAQEAPYGGFGGLQVRLAIMRGLDDGALSWPFRKNVKTTWTSSLETAVWFCNEISTSKLALSFISRPTSEENDSFFIFYLRNNFWGGILLSSYVTVSDSISFRVEFSSIDIK